MLKTIDTVVMGENAHILRSRREVGLGIKVSSFRSNGPIAYLPYMICDSEKIGIMRGNQNKYMKLELMGKEDREGRERNGNNIKDS